MYVHHMYIKYDLLMPVFRPTAHVRRLFAIYTLIPSLPPSSAPPYLYGRILRSLSYFSVCTIRFKAALVPDGHIACPHVAKPCNEPRSIFFMYAHYMDIPYTLLMHVALPTVCVWHSSAV